MLGRFSADLIYFFLNHLLLSHDSVLTNIIELASNVVLKASAHIYGSRVICLEKCLSGEKTDTSAAVALTRVCT